LSIFGPVDDGHTDPPSMNSGVDRFVLGPALVAVLVAGLPACSARKAPAPAGSSSTAPTPSPSGPPELRYGPAWRRYSLAPLGISFDFPAMPGTQGCALHDHRKGSDGAGVGYFCDETLPIVTEDDRLLGRGYRYGFIGATSPGFSEGRDCWFTDVQRVSHQEGKTSTSSK
jgi:hypothetical protein